MSALATRQLECWGCGTNVTIPLEERWTPNRKDLCPSCGTALTDHARAAEIAADRMTMDEAAEIMTRHTWDDVMSYARLAYEEPAALTAEQRSAMFAFLRLRSTQQHQN